MPARPEQLRVAAAAAFVVPAATVDLSGSYLVGRYVQTTNTRLRTLLMP